MSAAHQPSVPPTRCWPLGGESVRINTALRYDDYSSRARFGCKGPQAEAWLSDQGFSVPPQPNTAAVDGGGVLVARLAMTEFLIEEVDGGTERVARAATQIPMAAPVAGVYAIARQDVVIGIDGTGSGALLRQICSIDFTALLEHSRVDGGPVALTSMVGVSVVAWPRRTSNGASLTLWLDPSFGHYFCSTLIEVGSGIGGTFSVPAGYSKEGMVHGA